MEKFVQNFKCVKKNSKYKCYVSIKEFKQEMNKVIR